MTPLETECFRENIGTQVMKVSGFTEEEFDDLKRMDYRDMKQTVLWMLDERNNGTGTCWHNGYGVYSMFFNDIYPGCIFVEIGNSCD